MKTYKDIIGDGGSGILEQVQDQAVRLKANLADVKTVFVIASGKGGVGKSSVATGLAVALAEQGRSVGILDCDLHGCSVARLLGMTGFHLSLLGKSVIQPLVGPAGIRVMSLDFIQKAAEPLRWKNVPAGDEFTWRATLEMSLLREFLTDLPWGGLDALILDVPPGSDRLANLASLLEPGRMSIALVTIPSALSQGIVEKSFGAAKDKGLFVRGLIENMKGFLCPGCEAVQPLYSGDASVLARRLGTPYLGGIPFDPAWARLGDEGKLGEFRSWHETIKKAFLELAENLLQGE